MVCAPSGGVACCGTWHQILLASTNVVDDVEHCLKADTSPHLVEQLTGNRTFWPARWMR